MSFDENGDALPIYDVMNWLWLPDGQTEVQNVGDLKISASYSEELTLDVDKIFWNFKSQKVNRFPFVSFYNLRSRFKEKTFTHDSPIAAPVSVQRELSSRYTCGEKEGGTGVLFWLYPLLRGKDQ